MAIAEPALRGFIGSYKVRIRGLNPLTIAVGVGVGIGTYLYENWEVFNPTGGSILNPGGSRKPGTPYLNASQKNASAYRQRQTYRTSNKFSRSKRHRVSCQCCCC